MGKRRRGPPHQASSDQSDQFRHHKSRKANHTTPVSPLRTRIRDIERLLSHRSDIPADVHLGLERELAAVRHDLAMVLAENERRDMIRRYHMVRFFDRQKATRRLKKTNKALEECADPSEKEALNRQVHVAEVDLNYTIYYPLERPYSALYPTKKGEDGKVHEDVEASESGKRGDKAMWEIIEHAMEEGTLEALRMTLTVKEVQLRSQKRYAPRPAEKNLQTQAGADWMDDLPAGQGFDEYDEAEEESDGGFFEQDGGVSLMEE